MEYIKNNIIQELKNNDNLLSKFKSLKSGQVVPQEHLLIVKDLVDKSINDIIDNNLKEECLFDLNIREGIMKYFLIVIKELCLSSNEIVNDTY